MKKLMGAALAFGTMFATPAVAVTILGTTNGGPVFNRTVTGTPPTSLSSAGTAVRYQATTFTVATSGSYSFLMTGLIPAGWDTYLGLYVDAFNPAAPLTNAVVYNDDFPVIGLSGFSSTLTAGTSYIALATGFANNDFGTYSLATNGPGAINVVGGNNGAVPETSTWAMIITGFGIAGGALRRRRRVSVAFA